MAQRSATLLAAVLLVYAAASTSFWSGLQRAADGESYERQRIARAFGGLDIERIGRRIDEITQDRRPIALGASLATHYYFGQRLVEALYPRIISSRAVTRLSVAASETPAPDAETVFVVGNLRLELSGIGARGALPLPAPDPPGLIVELLGALDAFLGALCLGALVWLFVLRQRVNGPAELPVLLLLGALVIACEITLRTWLQAQGRASLTGLGFASSMLFVYATLRTRATRVRWSSALGELVAHRENFAFAAFLGLFALRMLRNPIALWDGRSIWLFHAKRISEHGIFLVSDLTHADTLWSHPDYPLFFPSWLSFFGGHFARFSERAAGLGIAALFAALCALNWRLARARLGRFCGGAFVLSLALGTDRITAGGYADGLLRLLLVAEFLAFASGAEQRRLAWIAAACASLMKGEGFVFAFLIAAGFFAHERRTQAAQLARRALPFLVFVPAVVHTLYVGSLGIDSVLKSKTTSEVIAQFLPRLGEVLAAAPSLLVELGYTQLRPALWQGVLGALALVYALARRTKLPPTAKLALMLALAMAAFSVCTISALPENATWFVRTALGRLLLHPAALLVLAALLTLRAPTA